MLHTCTWLNDVTMNTHVVKYCTDSFNKIHQHDLHGFSIMFGH